MKRQRVKFPWDLFWENKTYKLKRFIGGLSEDDGEGQRDRQKVIDLYEQTTTLQVHHAFLHISSACSQTLYFLFKVRRARVIKYKPQGIY